MTTDEIKSALHASRVFPVGNIFLLQSSNELVKLKEAQYDSEELLQQLIAQYPDLLAGDQIDSADPRRWLLVCREMAVPDEEDGSGRWSLDHLFLDQDAIPTLVEVKRSSDTRIRREVVGQMLDYAANGVVYWPVEQIQRQFEKTCEKAATNPEEKLLEFLGPNGQPVDFWNRVKTNLLAGKIRLVFVADEIPSELQRVVEFLNKQMDPAEVLALEVKQYVGQGLKTLVPRVFGHTAESEGKKPVASPAGRKWDETSFFEALKAKRGEDEAKIARRILDWAEKSELRIWWGEGATAGSFYPMLDWKGNANWVIAVWTYGKIYIQFYRMKNRPPFDDEQKRSELCNRLNRIQGVSLSADAVNREPYILLSTLTNEASLTDFLAALQWYVNEVKTS
jgi:hypothetical protein